MIQAPESERGRILSTAPRLERRIYEARSSGAKKDSEIVKSLLKQKKMLMENITVSERSTEKFRSVLREFTTATTDEQRETIQARLAGQIEGDKRGLEL